MYRSLDRGYGTVCIYIHVYARELVLEREPHPSLELLALALARVGLANY